MGPEWEDKLELISRVNKTYDVCFTREEFLAIAEVGDLLQMVLAKLQMKPKPDRRDETVIWPELQDLIAAELGVRVRDIQRDVRFYEDLNCGGRIVDGAPYEPWWDRHALLVVLGAVLGLIAAWLCIALGG